VKYVLYFYISTLRSMCAVPIWPIWWNNTNTGLDRPRMFQISRQSAHKGGKVISLTHRPPLSPRKYSWYSFLLEAKSATGSKCGRKDYVNDTNGNRTRDLPSCKLGRTDLSQFHPTRNTSQQQHRWTLPEAVVTVICSWWWAKTSPETRKADEK